MSKAPKIISGSGLKGLLETLALVGVLENISSKELGLGEGISTHVFKGPKPGHVDGTTGVGDGDIDNGYLVDMDVPGYERLANTLKAAYTQAADGKGKERHAKDGESFEDQPIFDMAKRFGAGSLLAQAFKKMDESQRLPAERAVRELLGAIVYCAAAVMVIENNYDAAGDAGAKL
jgi:hypothetical protein